MLNKVNFFINNYYLTLSLAFVHYKDGWKNIIQYYLNTKREKRSGTKNTNSNSLGPNTKVSLWDRYLHPHQSSMRMKIKGKSSMKIITPSMINLTVRKDNYMVGRNIFPSIWLINLNKVHSSIIWIKFTCSP